MSSPYRVLGVGPAATTKAVLQAYRETRAGRWSQNELRGALDRLRNPEARLDQDVLEPDADLGDDVVAALGRLPGKGFVDAASAPLPAWAALVRPVDPGGYPPEHDVLAPERGYRVGQALEPPGCEILPPFEFPL